MKENDSTKKGRRLSMHGSDPDDALKAFMEVDPEKVKYREQCTCERWPMRGGTPDPNLPDILRGVTIDQDAIDPACPIHGPSVVKPQEDEDA